jgi:hypothetical protein
MRFPPLSFTSLYASTTDNGSDTENGTLEIPGSLSDTGSIDSSSSRPAHSRMTIDPADRHLREIR